MKDSIENMKRLKKTLAVLAVMVIPKEGNSLLEFLQRKRLLRLVKLVDLRLLLHQKLWWKLQHRRR